MTARDIALDLLNQVEERKIFVNIALNNSRALKQLPKSADRGLVYKLVYGVIQNRSYLDYVLNHFMKKGMEKQRMELGNILRLGAYQLLFLDKIPDHAACNEAVEQAKQQGFRRASGFVNGVLRNIARNPHVALPDRNKDLIKYLAIRYSHPAWMVSRWLERWGSELCEQLLIANNSEPDLTVRVNTIKTSLLECQKSLESAEVEVSPGRLVPLSALRCANVTALDKLEGFQKGYFTVQDEASIYVSTQLAPSPGDKVLDMCSAPGGKTAHMAALMGNKGTIIAADIHQHRLNLVEDNMLRLGVEIVSTLQADASQLEDITPSTFDKVLCDAPCTGLGTLRSKPEAKWYKKPEDIAAMSKLQKQLLNKGIDLLREKGRIVYSTCTNELEETDEVISSVSAREDIKLISQEHLLPFMYDTDGFFIAVLEKQK